MVGDNCQEILGINTREDLNVVDAIVKACRRINSWLFDKLQIILKQNLDGVFILDNEFVLKQFEEIERKVEKLIETCKALEATNLDQENKIKRLEEEIQGKVEAERSYTEEKALIRSKIDGLLVKLDEVSAE